LTSEIKKLLFDRDNKKRRAMITKLNADWDEYQSSRNKVDVALPQAKADYNRNKIATQSNNPKEAWKTINSLLGCSPSFSDTSVNELKVDYANLTSPGRRRMRKPWKFGQMLGKIKKIRTNLSEIG
jgi:hypothetical protein